MYRTISHDPQREPWDLPDLEPRDGLARLLAEARSGTRRMPMARTRLASVGPPVVNGQFLAVGCQ